MPVGYALTPRMTQRNPGVLSTSRSLARPDVGDMLRPHIAPNRVTTPRCLWSGGGGGLGGHAIPGADNPHLAFTDHYLAYQAPCQVVVKGVSSVWSRRRYSAPISPFRVSANVKAPLFTPTFSSGSAPTTRAGRYRRRSPGREEPSRHEESYTDREDRVELRANAHLRRHAA